MTLDNTNSGRVDNNVDSLFDDGDYAAVSDLSPKITVFGVGGAGGNAVNNMIRQKLRGVDFVVANTDAQALLNSLADNKIQLGLDITRGLGAGARPDIGRAAAEEVIQDILSYIKDSNMVFITAGMGGGTGTGAAPVIARLAKENGILTIGVVTKPFHFEGTHRMRTAERGIDELQQFVDTLIVIPNQNLFRVATERTTFADAFKMADDVLRSGVQGVTDLMVMPGLINLDFSDIRTVMSEMGKAMMGTGDAEGEGRALEAAEAAISNPLLDDVSMKGARGVLVNITGGYDMTLYEVDEAANRIRAEVDPEANIIFGSTFNEKLNGRIRVSVVATGIDASKEMMKNNSANFSPSSVNSFSKQYEESQLKSNTPNFIQEQAGVQQEEKLSNNSVEYADVRNEALTAKPQQQRKKHVPSLFERITGRYKHEEVEVDSHVRTDIYTRQSVEQSNQQDDDLDIPAFLRK